jgi:hypothetical protein
VLYVESALVPLEHVMAHFGCECSGKESLPCGIRRLPSPRIIFVAGRRVLSHTVVFWGQCATFPF